MLETPLPLMPALWAPLPAPDPARLLEELATLRLENAALRAQNTALQERIRELEARLGQTSANSSRPPSSDPPQAPARPKAPPSGRKRGGRGQRVVPRIQSRERLRTRKKEIMTTRPRASESRTVAIAGATGMV